MDLLYVLLDFHLGVLQQVCLALDVMRRRKREISREAKGGTAQGCRGRWRQREEVEDD